MTRKKTDNRFNLLEETLPTTRKTLVEQGVWISSREKANDGHVVLLVHLDKQWLNLQAAINTLQDEVIDLEACSRRGKTKVLGLPEKVEDNIQRSSWQILFMICLDQDTFQH